MQEIGKSEKIVIGMVGLPARGKTYLSRKVNRYINWLGFKSRVFNIGNYRRDQFGTDCNQNFFDPKNQDAVKKRDECAIQALNDLSQFLKEGGDVGIYDGTNTTKQRRQLVISQLQKQFTSLSIFWIESICDDDDVVQKNIRLTKLNNPDYVGKDHDEAIKDFVGRIEQYKQVYQPIDSSENIRYVKIINIGKNIIIHSITGYLESRIVSYLMNLHIYPRPIYLTRHGESTFNVQSRIGGDPGLTELGIQYSQQLSNYLKDESKQQEEFAEDGAQLFTSTLQRGIQTTEIVSKTLETDYYSLKILDEINSGICDGLSLQEIREKFPKEYRDRQFNKLSYRYPRGESYLDVISRIEPVIFEIERTRKPVIVIGHQAVLRCLYAFFHQNEVYEVPKIELPLHSLVKLVPKTYYCTETRIEFDVLKNERKKLEDFQIKKVKSYMEL